jgi:PPM family protein phosphatase
VKVARSAAATDPGRRRRHNEDAYVCEPPLFAVADGIGGAQAGEVASRLAATALRETGADGADPRRHVDALIQEANRRVYERQTSDASASGMGTTITVALLHDDMVWIGHVGDSRAYLIRKGRLEQLTQDHSLVAELVRSGKLSPEEAETHPQRSVITRALGTDPDVDVDTFAVDAQPGDIFLICSDGLSSMVDIAELEDILRRHRDDLAGASRALIHAANRGGGEDNITAVLFAVDEGGAAPPGAGEPDEETRELALQFDEEDTLHPEDGVAPPPPLEGDYDAAPRPAAVPAAVDTMVVPASEIDAALARQEEEHVPQAGLGRRLLALLVIVILVATIVVLVWWGLAR